MEPVSGSLFVKRLRSLLDSYPMVRRLLVGYSGGVDSHVLLHLLASHREALAGRALGAVYVDHGLQAASQDWGRHCEAICGALDVDFFSLRVDASAAPGESPEAAARRVRYAALGGFLEEQDALLTAHHLDDQAETLLLQLLRGGGPHGLAAMPAAAALGRGWLLRPLLDLERADILSYATGHGLVWIEDASNADPGVDRNYLRHEILPRLKRRWPAAARTLARSARLCAEAAVLTDIQGKEDLAVAAGERPDCLNIPVLRTLDVPRQRNLLRCWFQGLDLPAPSAVHLQHILADAVASARDRQPCVGWPGGEVRRYRDQLFAMSPLKPHDAAQVWALTADRSLTIPGVGILTLRAAPGQGICMGAVAGNPLTLRFRRGGERFRPVGRPHSQVLKKLLQEAEIPPWDRNRLPLLYAGETLVAVAGLWVSADFATQKREQGLVLEWQKGASSGTV